MGRSGGYSGYRYGYRYGWISLCPPVRQKVDSAHNKTKSLLRPALSGSEEAPEHERGEGNPPREAGEAPSRACGGNSGSGRMGGNRSSGGEALSGMFPWSVLEARDQDTPQRHPAPLDSPAQKTWGKAASEFFAAYPRLPHHPGASRSTDREHHRGDHSRCDM